MVPRRFGRGLHFGSQGFGQRPRQGDSSNADSAQPQGPRAAGLLSPGHAPARQVPEHFGQGLRPGAGSHYGSRLPGGLPTSPKSGIPRVQLPVGIPGRGEPTATEMSPDYNSRAISSTGGLGRMPSSQPATNPREIRPQGQRSQPTSLRRQYDESNKRKRPGEDLKEDTFTGGWMVTLKRRLNIGAGIDPAALRNSMKVPRWGSRQDDIAMSEVDTPIPTASAGLPDSATSAPTQPPVATCLSDNPASRIGVLSTKSREHCQERNTPCMVYGYEVSASVPAASERGRQ